MGYKNGWLHVEGVLRTKIYSEYIPSKAQQARGLYVISARQTGFGSSGRELVDETGKIYERETWEQDGGIGRAVFYSKVRKHFLRTYTVDEIKELLGLDGFHQSEHFNQWNNFHQCQIDWQLINSVTKMFKDVDSELNGLKELLRFMKNQVHSYVDLTSLESSKHVSIRIAPTVETGIINDASWLNVGTYWDGAYYLGLSQVGQKGYINWKTYGECFRIPLGETPHTLYQANKLMDVVMGKRVVSVV